MPLSWMGSPSKKEGHIYSGSALHLERKFPITPLKPSQTNHIAQTKINRSRIPSGRRKPSWLWTSEAEELKCRLPARWWSECDLNSGSPQFENGTLATQPLCLLNQISFDTHCMEWGKCIYSVPLTLLIQVGQGDQKKLCVLESLLCKGA